MATKNNVAEMLFTPDWHYLLSPFLGDLVGEIGYITQHGTIHLLGKKDLDISQYETETKIDGPVTSITANKSLGLF
jgi:hypothetical protein